MGIFVKLFFVIFGVSFLASCITEQERITNKGYYYSVEGLFGGENKIKREFDKTPTLNVDFYGEKGITALMAASSTTKYLNIVKFLVENKNANIKLKSEKNKRSALFFAAQNRNTDEIIKYLVNNKKMDVNERDINGKTPLMIAAVENNVNIVQFLLSKGADPDIEDKEGMNSLMHASYNAFDYRNVEILAKKVKNINRRSKEDKTALNYFMENQKIKGLGNRRDLEKKLGFKESLYGLKKYE